MSKQFRTAEHIRTVLPRGETYVTHGVFKSVKTGRKHILVLCQSSLCKIHLASGKLKWKLDLRAIHSLPIPAPNSSILGILCYSHLKPKSPLEPRIDAKVEQKGLQYLYERLFLTDSPGTRDMWYILLNRMHFIELCNVVSAAKQLKGISHESRTKDRITFCRFVQVAKKGKGKAMPMFLVLNTTSLHLLRLRDDDICVKRDEFSFPLASIDRILVYDDQPRFAIVVCEAGQKKGTLQIVDCADTVNVFEIVSVIRSVAFSFTNEPIPTMNTSTVSTDVDTLPFLSPERKRILSQAGRSNRSPTIISRVSRGEKIRYSLDNDSPADGSPSLDSRSADGPIKSPLAPKAIDAGSATTVSDVIAGPADDRAAATARSLQSLPPKQSTAPVEESAELVGNSNDGGHRCESDSASGQAAPEERVVPTMPPPSAGADATEVDINTDSCSGSSGTGTGQMSNTAVDRTRNEKMPDSPSAVERAMPEPGDASDADDECEIDVTMADVNDAIPCDISSGTIPGEEKPASGEAVSSSVSTAALGETVCGNVPVEAADSRCSQAHSGEVPEARRHSSNESVSQRDSEQIDQSNSAANPISSSVSGVQDVSSSSELSTNATAPAKRASSKEAAIERLRSSSFAHRTVISSRHLQPKTTSQTEVSDNSRSAATTAPSVRGAPAPIEATHSSRVASGTVASGTATSAAASRSAAGVSNGASPVGVGSGFSKSLYCKLSPWAIEHKRSLDDHHRRWESDFDSEQTGMMSRSDFRSAVAKLNIPSLSRTDIVRLASHFDSGGTLKVVYRKFFDLLNDDDMLKKQLQ